MPRFALAVAAIFTFSAIARAQSPILIEVFPSVGPNIGNPGAAGSPSYADYAAQAATGVGAGGTATGTPGSPSFYQSVPNGSTVPVLDIVATDFPSWRGGVNPSAPFDAELGNRLYFGVRIVDAAGDGFSLGNLSYGVTDTLDGSLTFGGDFSGLEYSPERIGVIYGPSGPTFITSGSNTQVVNELWAVGIGAGIELFAAGFPGGPPTTGTLADVLPSGLPFQLSATYRLVAPNREDQVFSGSGEVTIGPSGPVAVPGPAGLTLGLIALGGYLVKRRRMSQTQDR